MLFYNGFKDKKEKGRKIALERYWDDSYAEYRYRLVEYPYDKKGETILDGDGEPMYYWKAGGDKDWANKTAKHYKLKITEA